MSSVYNPHHQITIQTPKVSKIAVGLLLGVLLFGMFIVGYDQGHLFSLAQGEQAYKDLWMHEFYHDMRHAAGFPCH
ncbi:MAG: CbtB-domain containing protein [Thermoproteota archaeon]|nr:CbtB-domain containing protein [Thermoproteota archaeon]